MSDRRPTTRPEEVEPTGALARRLRAADPVEAEAELEAPALARIAARLDAVRPEPVRSPWRFALPLAVATSVVAVAWIVPGQLRAPAERTAASVERLAHEETGPFAVEPAPNGTPTTAAETGAEARQIQFVTAGGTRVIWVLDPAFTF